MREIKFRAWDKNNKKMLEVDGINFNEFGFKQYKSAAIACELPGTELSQIVNLSEVELMQYTGLKDKNGKEIYEGDIVMAINYHCGATEVLTVRYFMGSPCLCFKEQDTGTPLYPLIVTHSFEVIGNTYEHPQLLGDQP